MRNRMLSLIVCLLAAMMMVLPAMAEETGLTWDMAEEILTHISDPVFPDYEVNVLDFGAVPNDDQLDTAAIQAAIDHVSEQGGGKVIVPSGTFDTGAITLKSNVNLCLESEDTLLLYTREINHDNYPLVYCHYEGSGLYNWSPLVYAYQAENIALTGKGTLDGHADKDNWWNWSKTFNADGSTTSPQSADTSPLRKQTDARVPFEERVYGEGHYLRPNFFQVLNCTNVLVEGVTFKNSPMWIMNPVETVNFTARGVTVDTPRLQQRRLRSGELQLRAHRELLLQHRRRLHRHQGGPQRGRPRAGRGGLAEPEHHHPQQQLRQRPRRYRHGL